MKAAKLSKAPAYRWWILVMNMLAYGYFFMTIQTAAAFGTAIQEAMGLNATMLSFYTTATMISFALLAGPGGKLIAKVGTKKTILIALAIDVAASAVFAVAGGNYVSDLVLRFIQGISGGFIGAAAVNSTAMWFPVRQRGIAGGILLGVLGIGFTLATLGAQALLGWGLPWYTAMGGLTAVSGVVIFVLYLLTVREIGTVYPGAMSIAELLPEEAAADAPARDTSQLPGTMAEVRRNGKYWACAVVGFGNAFLVYGFGTFLMFLLMNDLVITSDLVTMVISSTFFITIVAAPLGGILSDNVFKGSRYQTLMIATGITAVTLVLIPIIGNASAIIVAVLLMLAYGSVSMILGPFWAIPNEITQPQIAGQCTGELTMLSNIGGIVVAPVFAALIDSTGTALICLGICVAVGVISFLCARFIHQ